MIKRQSPLQSIIIISQSNSLGLAVIVGLYVGKYVVGTSVRLGAGFLVGGLLPAPAVATVLPVGLAKGVYETKALIVH